MIAPKNVGLPSASCELDLWPHDPQSWSFHDVGTCVSFHQNRFRFTRFQNIVGRTSQVENILPLPVSPVCP